MTGTAVLVVLYALALIATWPLRVLPMRHPARLAGGALVFGLLVAVIVTAWHALTG